MEWASLNWMKTRGDASSRMRECGKARARTLKCNTFLLTLCLSRSAQISSCSLCAFHLAHKSSSSTCWSSCRAQARKLQLCQQQHRSRLLTTCWSSCRAHARKLQLRQQQHGSRLLALLKADAPDKELCQAMALYCYGKPWDSLHRRYKSSARART